MPPDAVCATRITTWRRFVVASSSPGAAPSPGPSATRGTNVARRGLRKPGASARRGRNASRSAGRVGSRLVGWPLRAAGGRAVRPIRSGCCKPRSAAAARTLCECADQRRGSQYRRQNKRSWLGNHGVPFQPAQLIALRSKRQRANRWPVTVRTVPAGAPLRELCRRPPAAGCPVTGCGVWQGGLRLHLCRRSGRSARHGYYPVRANPNLAVALSQCG
jgi:hypothetical protein